MPDNELITELNKALDTITDDELKQGLGWLTSDDDNQTQREGEPCEP